MSPRQFWWLAAVLLVVLVMLGACTTPDPQPSLRTYGVAFPLCIVSCHAGIETADSSNGGSVQTGGIAQSERGQDLGGSSVGAAPMGDPAMAGGAI